MPKLIDYPRTSYTGSWELAEIVDDTGGKCAIETAARKLNRKVSGSFKAIIGSAVKFGLVTSKRDLLTTTTLFKRIKHAYDKQEELIFHREAFLTPPLFTQLCRKFRSRELPVQMLDVMLIREFSVEEINAPGVAKAFVEGSRMVGLLDEHNIIADIDALAARSSPRRELASPTPSVTTFRSEQPVFATASELHSDNAAPITSPDASEQGAYEGMSDYEFGTATEPNQSTRSIITPTSQPDNTDAIASLFGLLPLANQPSAQPATTPLTSSKGIADHSPSPTHHTDATNRAINTAPRQSRNESTPAPTPVPVQLNAVTGYQIQISGPGMNTSLSISEEEDITLAIALLEKIRRQLKG